MAHESFEDTEVADYLNAHFIAIKVDREERPDIDQIYMSYCQATTGSGGWPLSILMTSDQKPFYAGTYFPKHSLSGHLGFMEILSAIADKWKRDQSSIEDSADKTVEALKQQESASFKRQLQTWVVRSGYDALKSHFDTINGGFSRAPKFPSPQNLMFFMAYHKATGEQEAIQMVEKTLEQMYRGGIYDHIGGGFSRYSVDVRWLVPHFEKMLYDNALLIMAYTEAYQITGKPLYRQVITESISYLLREMRHPEGGFYSAQDADSEGEEGRFYLWRPSEIVEVLGEADGDAIIKRYGITEQGNFERRNILNRLKDADVHDRREDTMYFDKLRQKLYDARSGRIAPGLDDKVLTAWNGMMISALCKASSALEMPQYLEAAEAAAAFIENNLMTPQGHLLSRYRDGEAKNPGLIDDYAYMIGAYIELYEATYKIEYLEKARNLQAVLDLYFIDEDNWAYYISSKEDSRLVVRSKVFYDGAYPCGNSVSANNLILLSRLLNDDVYRQQAQRIMENFGKILDEMPTGIIHMLTAKLRLDQPGREIVLAGARDDRILNQMVSRIRKCYHPFDLVLWNGPEESLDKINPEAAAKIPMDGRGTAYICEHFTCKAPVVTMEDFENMFTD